MGIVVRLMGYPDRALHHVLTYSLTSQASINPFYLRSCPLKPAPPTPLANSRYHAKGLLCSALASRAEDYAPRCTSASLARAVSRFPLNISHHMLPGGGTAGGVRPDASPSPLAHQRRGPSLRLHLPCVSLTYGASERSLSFPSLSV